MIYIEKTNNKEIINSIYDFLINDFNDYFLIKENDNILGLFEIQPITRITGILHLHIKSEYQKKNLAINAFISLMEHLKKTDYKQIIGSIPANNKKIMNIVNKTEGKCCGILKDAIIFENKLQDLLLFQIEV